MNKIYKVVWCKATQSLVAVSEFAKSQGKGSASKPRLAKPLLLKSMTIAVLLGISGQSWATCDTTGNKVECGTGSSAHSSQGVAVGSRAKAAGKQSSAFGNDTTAYGVGSLAFGGDDTRAGTSPSVYGVLNGGIGVNNDYRRTLSAGTASTAISMHSQALANGSTAIGAGATAGSASGTINATTGVLTGYSQTSGTDSTAIGALSNAANDNSSAFGARAKATKDGAVALGAGSVAATAAGATGAYDPQNQTRTGSTWVSTLGAVSVGEDTSTADTTNAFEVTRQIQGVAAGKVDTDAVNVAQLKAAQTHYFSVNSDDSAAPSGTNWNNDGASASNAIAIGKEAMGKQADSLAIGHGASSDVLSGVSLGAVSYTHNGSSVIGNYTGLYTLDENYYATGIPQKGFGATALGAGAQAFGTTDSFKTGGVAIGFVAQANGSSTVGIGTRAEAKGHKAVAIGHFAKTDAISATAIGDKATASKENAIALGSQSVADRVAITATGVTAVTGTADPASNQVYSPIADDTAVKATVKGNLAAVSVGNTNNTRQITHVAAGSQDTDAVNVAQLKAATQASDKQTYFHANDADASNDKNTNTTNYGSVDDTAGAQGINSVAAGINARAMEEGSVAIGENAWSIAEDGYAMGSGARARGENSIALGTGANAGAATGTATSKEETIAIGNNTQAYASQAITIGSDTKTSGAFGIAIGSNTAARKVNSTGYAGVAIGSGGGNMGAMANGESSVAIGGGNSASSGLDGAVAGGKNAVAIGSGSSAGLKGAVALGSQSVAGRGVSTGSTAATYGGYNPITNTVDGTDATIDGTRSTLAAVSVGDANGTKYRQITNVAAGTENTDVVNVAQLKAASQPWKLRQAGGSNNSINPTDTVEFESGTYTTATVTAENNGVTKVKYDIAADKAKLTFAGDSGTSDVNLGNTYNIKGTTNEIVTTDNGTGTLNIKLADAVKNDIAEGKTIVIGGTNITNVESSGGTGGTPVTYTINADGVTASAGSSAVTVMAGTKDANNVTDYAIDLSQDTKDAIAAGKTIVTAGANTKVTKTAGTDATPDSYVVDAEDTTVTAGSSYVTVSDTLTTGAGVDDYKVDVSQDVKDAAEAVKTGLTFTGDSGTTNNELLGSTIAVNGDSNITTKASGDSITIQLNDDITVTSVTADKVTVGSVTIDNTNGINAGDTQIKGVKAGTAGTDAVNKDQLDAVSQNLANATFGIKAEDSNSVTNTVNNTIDLVGDGKNISTKVEGGKVVVAIKDSPKFGDVTINDGGKITGLTNGNIADGSQEAITGDQLFDTNETVAKGINVGGTTGSNKYALGDTINVKGDSNVISTTIAGGVQLGLADSVTIGSSKPVTINGNDGTVTGLTNVDIGSLDDGSSGTSIAATEAQLSKVNATANAGWNLTANSSNTSNVAPNDTVDLANTDGNIELVKSGNNVKFELADDITVDSVTAGDTVINNDGITIANGSAGNPVSLTKDGLDNGGNKVINVADGAISSTSKDAVNGSQLHVVSTANKNIFGGNAAVQADGSVTMSNVGGTGKDNIHDAIASVKTLAGQHSTTTAGKNIEVVETTNANGSTNYAVKTKDAVEFDNVTVGDVVINKDNGINAGDKVISNVASGLNGRTIEAVKTEGSGAAEWNNAATIGDLTTVQNAVSNVYEVIGGQNTSGDAVDGDGNVLTDTDGNPISAKAALQTYDVAGQTATDNNTVISAIKNMNEGGIKYFHTNDASGQTTGGAVANTDDSSASGKFSTAVGYQASATAENALALGNASQATGKNAIAIGTGNKVSGENSGAIGDPNVVSGNASYALGNDNTVTTNKTFVVGNDVSKTLDNSVILGDSSEAIAIHTTATGGNYTYNGANDANVVGVNDVVGVVSVGKDGETRQIQNVAAGVVSATSTDAINGSQLHYTNMAVAGNSANIAINAGNIANNTGRITTNAGNIITNAGNIVTNATHIQANANEIAKGINFAGDEGSLNRQLGDTVTIGGGLAKEAEASSRNIRTVAADDKVTLLVAENPEFKSVTVEKGLVINEGATVNMGNNRVQNVAAGVNPTDAVNIRQLAGAYQRINEVNQNANAGIAAALATATISQPVEPGGNTFGLSLGTYEGQQAISVGVSTLSDNGKWTIKGAFTQDSQSNTGAAVGVNYNW